MKLFIVILLAAIAIACSQHVTQTCGGLQDTQCDTGYHCRQVSEGAIGTCEKDEAIFCGGIQGINCPIGLTCNFDGDYPDASGECVNPRICANDNDCVRQDIACDCGSGEWVNKEFYKALPENTVRCKCALRDAIGACDEGLCTGTS